MTAALRGPIVCLGDSIAASGWPAALEEKLAGRGLSDIRCFNAGVRGNTSRQGLKRLEKDVFSRKPQIVTVQFGFNDCNIVLNGPRPRVLPGDFQSSLRQMFMLIRQSGSEVCLILNHQTLVSRILPDGQPYEAHSRLYTEIAEATASDAHVQTVDMRKMFPGEGLKPSEALAEDGIHLNDTGVRRYAEIVASFLTEQLILPSQ